MADDSRGLMSVKEEEALRTNHQSSASSSVVSN